MGEVKEVRLLFCIPLVLRKKNCIKQQEKHLAFRVGKEPAMREEE